MDVLKISSLIKLKRKEKGMTQEELGTKLNVTEKAVSRWETGRGTPDISLLIPLSKELDLDVSELLSGSQKTSDTIEDAIDVIKYEKESKRVKKKKPLIISDIIYVVFLIVYLSYLKLSYRTDSYTLNYVGHIVFNIFFCVLIIISNWNLYTNYYDSISNKVKIKKITYGIILIIYIVMILNMTIFGRNMALFNFNGFKNGFKYGGFNIIPFKTILEYIINFERYNVKYIMVNIVGNIIIFMPVQYLFMKVFEDLSLKKYLLIDFVVLLIIELMQLITSCGAFDIDDIFLNILGMYIVYFVIKKVRGN